MKILTQFAGPSSTLLDYALATTPAPLQVSPQSGPPSVGMLTFVLSCPVAVGEAKVAQISFNLPVGDPNAPQSTDLTETATGITASVSSSGADEWQIGPGAAPGSFVLKPSASGTGLIDGQGITVTLGGIEINQIVGTATLSIVEMASSQQDPLQPRNCDIRVAKFPYGFFAGDFGANVPMVENGETVTLSWIGSSGPNYTLMWATQTQDVSSVRQWISPGLTDTTCFILVVTAQQGGQSVTLQFSLTVVVATPDITAKSITVLTTSTLKGAVTAQAGVNVSGAPITGYGTVPVGTVIAYGGDASTQAATLAAQGWLFCDGSAVSRSTYAALFTAVGTAHGAGDGNSTFNLPDYRGRFQRGTDHGAHRDPDISVRTAANPGGAVGDNTGSVQPNATAMPVYNPFTNNTTGAHTHSTQHVPSDNSSYRIAGSSLAKWNNDWAPTTSAGDHTHTISGGDHETRPINAYVDYLIRCF